MNKNKLLFLQILTGLVCICFTGIIVNMVWGKGIALTATTLIVCVMMVLEAAALPKIIIYRNNTDDLGGKAVNYFIKFLTFFTYIAAYAVISYGALIIKYSGEKLFGLSRSFLSSLPLSLMCMGIFAALLLGQKIKKLLGIRLYVAFTGACGILSMYMPFIRLKTFQILLSSILIGFCLGLERWLMNYFVAVSSDSESDTSVKFGYYNCGLLAGLTIGGALGGIISYAKSCRYVYFAGGIILLAVYLTAFFVVPRLYIESRENVKAVCNEVSSFIPLLKELCRRPRLVKDILTSVVPLNIGLMFIVSFLHILIAVIGLNTTINTYSYMLYGFMGNYLGLYIVKRFKNLNENIAGFIAFMFMFLSIAVLIPKVTLPGIFVCAAFAGLFDGYGGTVLTALPISGKNAEGMDKSVLLNGIAMLGSIVSMTAPLIYGVMLNLGSLRFNLIAAAAFFGLSGLYTIRKNKNSL